MLGFIVGTIAPTAPERKAPLRAVLTLCVLTFLTFAFVNVGKWLVREDPLQNAAAIAVLSGRMPDRALEAARIYKQGYAPEVWLTHSTEPGGSLAKFSLQYVGEDSYDKLLLIHEGVPESAIHILDPPVENTADEMATIGAALSKEREHKVILVTSRVHTRRTKALWDRLSSKSGEAIVRGVSDDSFRAEHWWANTTDALDVVREVLGLLNAWAGLPLRPAGT
jgi:uncharacterized SAM-binding protein YcdF (DUF218 family)